MARKIREILTFSIFFSSKKKLKTQNLLQNNKNSRNSNILNFNKKNKINLLSMYKNLSEPPPFVYNQKKNLINFSKIK